MSTMVDPKRLSGGRRFSLKPEIARAISAVPPLGYKSPPSLIGYKIVNPSILALRVRNYNQAYKEITIRDWNNYVALGIQQFSDPKEYLIQRSNETSTETNLRLARYYRLHLKNKKSVDKYLLQLMVGVEAALQYQHPGYFDMSVTEMDAYLLHLKDTSGLAIANTSPDSEDAMDVATTPPASPSQKSAAHESRDRLSALTPTGPMLSTPTRHTSTLDRKSPGSPDSTPADAVAPVSDAPQHGSLPVAVPASPQESLPASAHASVPPSAAASSPASTAAPSVSTPAPALASTGAPASACATASPPADTAVKNASSTPENQACLLCKLHSRFMRRFVLKPAGNLLIFMLSEPLPL